ncbi:MAG: AbgT family transporter [Gammaproteobacteria bacterium]|nr:MAG: AbgT family transporter [Gammaproteobacteria bacterium]
MTLLNRIEETGNRLPDPATLFAIGTGIIMILSWLATTMSWQVHSELTGTLITQNLLSSDGIWWLLSNMVNNFIKFPPLAIVLVGMLGIGLAERSGFLPALLRRSILLVPQSLLTPATIFLGIMSSMALDAGYVVLPPIAAALYIAAGRSPLTGIAAVFAGISAGFSANLLITALDPLLSGLTQTAAQILVADYQVAVTANWWFMLASTILLTLVGWAVTAWFVEPRVGSDHDLVSDNEQVLNLEDSIEKKGLVHALLATGIALIITALLITVPGAPLYGAGSHFSRWIEATVPLLFILFFVPGIVFGLSTGKIKNDKDVVKMLGDTIAHLAPYIVMAFFAAQFIECFKYTGLGKILAITGGQWLVAMQFDASMLLTGFILMAMSANLLIGSASAKYAFLAPVFVPMLMQVGFSPELTQVAYRIGDSLTNVITPMNPYMIIVLVELQRYRKNAGFGTLIALMLPYTVVFSIIWIAMLLIWMSTGFPLGPGGGLFISL